MFNSFDNCGKLRYGAGEVKFIGVGFSLERLNSLELVLVWWVGAIWGWRSGQRDRAGASNISILDPPAVAIELTDLSPSAVYHFCVGLFRTAGTGNNSKQICSSVTLI